MKILFIGCVQSSYILLNKLLENGAKIVGVITKKESKANSDFVDLASLCKRNGIKYIYVKNINDENSIEFAKNCDAEIAFCFGWSQLLKKEFLDKLRKGAIGFHPAALPYNKGRHPIIWALALGLKTTASSFFVIDEKADSGDIISQEEIEISYEDDAESLYEKIMDVAERQVVELWKDIERGRITRRKQTNNEGNSWRKRKEEDGKIDWRMSSYSIYNLVRALTRPYPGAYFCFNGKTIKVWKVEEILTDMYDNIEPGKILEVCKDGTIKIKAGENVIHILESDDIEIREGVYL